MAETATIKMKLEPDLAFVKKLH